MLYEEDKSVLDAAMRKARLHGIPWHKIFEAREGSVPVSMIDLIDEWVREGSYKLFLEVKRFLKWEGSERAQELLEGIQKASYEDSEMRWACNAMDQAKREGRFTNLTRQGNW